MVPRWGWFSVSATGVLTYVEGLSAVTQLVWIDRAGKRIGPLGDPAAHGAIELSPDGRRVATQVMAGTGLVDIWVIDVARGMTNRVTTGPKGGTYPVWSPDGRELVFARGVGDWNLYRKEPRAGATASPLRETVELRGHPQDWSRDGKILLYRTTGKENALWALPMEQDGPPDLVLKSEFSFWLAQMSPDGRWLAYMSNESGRYEIYVEPFRRPGERVRVSPDGGVRPRWRGDGRELFYASDDGQLMAVDVREGPSGLDLGMPEVLFDVDALGAEMLAPWDADYAVTADGQRFLLQMRIEQNVEQRVHVVTNWSSLLE